MGCRIAQFQRAVDFFTITETDISMAIKLNEEAMASAWVIDCDTLEKLGYNEDSVVNAFFHIIENGPLEVRRTITCEQVSEQEV